jgi:Protein of unknown function (DUF1488)
VLVAGRSVGGGGLSFAGAATMMVLVAVLPAWSVAAQSIVCCPG